MRLLDPQIFGDYPEIVKKNVGTRIPVFTKAELKQIKDTVDFIGVNHYTTSFVKDNPSSLQTDNRDLVADMPIELISVVNDFQNFNLTSYAQRGVIFSSGNVGRNKRDSSSSLIGANVQGLGLGKQKVSSKQESHVNEALDKLREQTREAVKRLESVTSPKQQMGADNLGSDAMLEDWVRQLKEFAAGSQWYWLAA